MQPNPFLDAGAGADEDLLEEGAGADNVVQFGPHDRLPVKSFFGQPPRASLYHTERAESARQRAEHEVPSYLAQARETLSTAGIRRADARYPDVADHNAMTLAYALAYAECGLTVVDAHAIDPKTGEGTGKQKSAKLPRGSKWQERASSDPAEIVSFWTGEGTYPATKGGEEFEYARVSAPRNVSIAFPPDCGMFVLDIDGDAGKAALAEMEEKHGPLPRTAKSVTGSGGWHFIFRASRPIRNTASQIAPGVDIRGEGGQIIAAPSIHKSGNFYQWEVTPWDCIADAPEWLVELAVNASKITGKKTTKKVQKTAQAGRRSTESKARDSEARGFQTILSTIGDHDGGVGFHGPIRDAALSWFGTHGPDVDSAELFDTLRARISEAERDPDRDRSKYDTDEYLSDRIEDARAYIKGKQAKLEAEPFDMAAPLGETLDEALFNLDRGFKYVNIGGEGRFVRVPELGEKPKLEVWTTTNLANWYADRKVTITTTDATGNQVEEEINPVPVFFNRARRWSATEFAPPPANISSNVFNLFRGFSVQPEPGDCTVLKSFILDVICDGDKDVFKWVWHWMAHMVQRPGEKPKTSLVIWGDGGAGKGTFGRLLRALVHPYGATFGSHDAVVGRWSGQSHALNIVGVSEEAVFSGNRREVNQLKHKIDSEEISVEVKNIQPIEMPSYMRYVFDSNHPDAMHIEGNGSERRYCVLHVSNAHRGDLEYFRDLREHIDGDGIKALFHELMTYDPADAGMEWRDVFTAPLTTDRENMERETMRPVHRAFATMIEDGEFIYKDGSETYRFDLTEGQTRIPKRMLRAFVEKHGDSRQAAETDPARVFERLFGAPLEDGRARCKCYYRGPGDDPDDWTEIDLNVQAYFLTPSQKNLGTWSDEDAAKHFNDMQGGNDD